MCEVSVFLMLRLLRVIGALFFLNWIDLSEQVKWQEGESSRLSRFSQPLTLRNRFPFVEDVQSPDKVFVCIYLCQHIIYPVYYVHQSKAKVA